MDRKGKETYDGPITGRPRIVDHSTRRTITEIKANDNYVQWFSSQIKDAYAYALQEGRTFVLKLTRPTAITKPLQKAAANSAGKFKIKQAK